MQSGKKVITASVIGNAMEWYDYLLYAYFASVISKLFFPMENTHHSNIITLAVFAGGFLARPFGGYIFGLIGDKIGRKTALTTSIALMVIPTALIGVLPTFAQIGMFAPAAMVLIRILQGISLGGEYSSSTTYLVESAPEGKKAFYGSFSSMSLALGLLVSAITVLIIEVVFTEEEVIAFAWRIPFLISLIYGMIGFYIRSQLHESDEFKNIKQKEKIQSPFKEIFLHHKKKLLVAIFVFMGLTIPFYCIAVFSKRIMVMVGFHLHEATMLNCLLVVIYMCVVPLSGFLTDKFGERKILGIASFLTAVFAVPIFYSIQSANITLTVFAMIVAGILIGLYQGAVPSVSAKSFETSVRASGVSLSYNIPAILFGGTAPMITTQIMQMTNGNVVYVAFYVIFGSVVAFFGSLFFKPLEAK